MRVLGIIPARGGSKGVPRKNIRLLGNKPLIGYTIEVCKRAKGLCRFVLSTEDSEIKSVAESYKCPVIDRPQELSLDSTPSLPVIIHAAEASASKFGEAYDAICLLQPTTPQRTQKHIDEAVLKFADSGADSLLSVCRVPDHFHPNWVFLSKENEGLIRACSGSPMPTRRQVLPPAYIRNGAIYLVRWNTLFANRTLYGPKVVAYEMPSEESINIDTMSDWELAEQKFKEETQK